MNVRIDGWLVGKVVIVSGGVGGCGGVVFELFVVQGVKVVIVDCDGDVVEMFVVWLCDVGLQVIGFGVDVLKQVDVWQVVEVVCKQYGNVDILFNYVGMLIVKLFFDIEELEWDWLMGVNVKSMFLMMQVVLLQMLEKGCGSIVCMLLILVVCVMLGEVLYDVIKGVCYMFVWVIVVEYCDCGICCNVLVLGFICMLYGMCEFRDLQVMGVDVIEVVIVQQQGWLCELVEVVVVVLFFVFDELSFVNGVYLFVDNCFFVV